MEPGRVVQYVSIPPKIIGRSRNSPPPTQLYQPLVYNSSSRIELSQCCHWSPYSIHTALHLFHSASAFWWPFWVYSLRISIVTFSSPHFVFTARQPSIISSSCFMASERARPSKRASEVARKREAERMHGWWGVSIMKGFEKRYCRIAERLNPEGPLESRWTMVQVQCRVGWGWWPVTTMGYVNSVATFVIGRLVQWCRGKWISWSSNDFWRSGDILYDTALFHTYQSLKYV